MLLKGDLHITSSNRSRGSYHFQAQRLTIDVSTLCTCITLKKAFSTFMKILKHWGIWISDSTFFPSVDLQYISILFFQNEVFLLKASGFVLYAEVTRPAHFSRIYYHRLWIWTREFVTCTSRSAEHIAEDRDLLHEDKKSPLKQIRFIYPELEAVQIKMEKR